MPLVQQNLIWIQTPFTSSKKKMNLVLLDARKFKDFSVKKLQKLNYSHLHAGLKILDFYPCRTKKSSACIQANNRNRDIIHGSTLSSSMICLQYAGSCLEGFTTLASSQVTPLKLGEITVNSMVSNRMQQHIRAIECPIYQFCSLIQMPLEKCS